MHITNCILATYHNINIVIVYMSSPESVLKNFISDGSDRTVQDCISKLKFISRIKEGEILDTKSLTLQEWDWSVAAYRTFIDRRQGRETSLEFYRTVIREAFGICINYIENPPGHFLHNTALVVLDCLESVSSGLQNHSKTYADDSKHVSDIETLIQTTDSKIADLRQAIEQRAVNNGNNGNNGNNVNSENCEKPHINKKK